MDLFLKLRHPEHKRIFQNVKFSSAYRLTRPHFVAAVRFVRMTLGVIARPYFRQGAIRHCEEPATKQSIDRGQASPSAMTYGRQNTLAFVIAHLLRDLISWIASAFGLAMTYCVSQANVHVVQ